MLKVNPLILLGARAGGGTAMAALRAMQDGARSKIPALGNILLTAWGCVNVLVTK